MILMTPQGRRFDQAMAQTLSNETHLIFVCGHYEGVDERIRLGLATDELSVGDYILTNGTLAAAIVIDAVVRLLPGALGAEGATADDSFSRGLLEYPQYTRPAEFRDMKVPEVLISLLLAVARSVIRDEKPLGQSRGNRALAGGAGKVEDGD